MINFKKNNKKKEPSKKILKNPKILEVNLVKNESLLAFNWARALFLMTIVLLVAVVFVLEINLGINSWQEKEEAKIELTNQQIFKINNQALTLKKENKEALNYKAKSQAFSAILANHIYWTNFFTLLEKDTLSSVKYTNFSGGLDGNYSLSAVAPTYADVSWQVKAFLNSPQVESVQVKSAVSTKDRDKSKPNQVSFTLLLKINPQVFLKNKNF